MRFCPFGFGIDVNRMPLVVTPLQPVLYAGAGTDIGLLGKSLWLGPFTFKSSMQMDFLNWDRYRRATNVDLAPGSFIKAGVEALEDLKKSVALTPAQITYIPIKVVIKGGCISIALWRFCYGDITLIDVKIPVSTNLLGRVEYHPFTFVPTVSALDIDVPLSQFDYWSYQHISRYPNGKQTPFDVVCYSDINRNHTDSYPRARVVVQDEITPVNLFIQNQVYGKDTTSFIADVIGLSNYFGKNYFNTFQARNNIVIGADVDYRADSLNSTKKRVKYGKVEVHDNSNITYVCGENDFIYFDDGFETSADFTSEITTKTYTYNADYQAEYFDPITKDTSHVNDGFGVPIDPVDSKYKTARKRNPATAQTVSEEVNKVDVSKLPDPSIGKFDEQAADALQKEKYEQHIATRSVRNSYVSPNPIAVRAVCTLSFRLNSTSKATVQILDMNGREVLLQELGEYNSGNQFVELDVSKLASGSYICTVKTNEYTDNHKFVVVQ